MKEVTEKEFDEFLLRYENNPLTRNTINETMFLSNNKICVAKVEDDYISNKTRYFIKEQK